MLLRVVDTWAEEVTVEGGFLRRMNCLRRHTLLLKYWDEKKLNLCAWQHSALSPVRRDGVRGAGCVLLCTLCPAADSMSLFTYGLAAS